MSGPSAGTGAVDARALVRESTLLLERAGCDSPALDAELLVAHAMGVDRAGLYRSGGESLDGEVAVAARDLITRRAAREPVAQIVGRRWFRNLELQVDSSVLSPRPETELLVEWGLGLPSGARVVDVGTGSGAIALALADERPDLKVIATDISEEALRVASANSTRLGLPVDLLTGDLLNPVEGPIDAVISNPPYIPEAEIDRLEPEVAEWEPRVALTSGPTGLETIERLARQASDRRVAMVAIEVGQGQAPEVGRLLEGLGWDRIELLADLAGIDRVVAGTRSSADPSEGGPAPGSTGGDRR